MKKFLGGLLAAFFICGTAFADSGWYPLTHAPSLYTDTIYENTSDHGVIIDGVTLKDGGGTFTFGSASSPITADSTTPVLGTIYTKGENFGLGAQLISKGLGSGKFPSAVIGLVTTDASDDAGSMLVGLGTILDNSASSTSPTAGVYIGKTNEADKWTYAIRSNAGADVLLSAEYNDANPYFKVYSGDNDYFQFQTVYNSGAKTVDYVEFKTDTSSATADDGKFVFDVDGTDILTIDDGGLEVTGSVKFSSGSVILGVLPKTEDYTLTVANAGVVTCDATSANVTFILPDAAGNSGVNYIIKKITAANSCIIDGLDADTIDGAATVTLTGQWSLKHIVSDGTNWIVIGSNTL